MFAKTIIDSDAFLDMPISARLLYYDLSMRADDDGFNNAPKKVIRTIGATSDDMNILIERKFVLPFESGVVVIKHWKIHNYIAKDRYKETKYKEEKSQLMLDENNAYTSCIQPVYECETQVRLGKDSIDKNNIYNTPQKIKKESPPKTYGLYNNIQLSENDLELLKKEFPADWKDRIESVSSWYHNKGLSCTNGAEQVRNWKMRGIKKYEKDDNRESESELFEQYKI